MLRRFSNKGEAVAENAAAKAIAGRGSASKPVDKATRKYVDKLRLIRAPRVHGQ